MNHTKRIAAVTGATQGVCWSESGLTAAGHEMRVADIVIGHYLKEGNQLQVTLEAVNVEDNRIIWHATVTAAKMDMIGIRKQITAQVGMGLLVNRQNIERPQNE
jgi:TolB-like protein